MKTPAKKTTHVHKLEVPLENHPVTDAKAEPAPKPEPKPAPPDKDGERDAPEAFGGKGDHDGDGKPGGDIKAQPKEPRPMPKDFKVETVREGSRVVARQDGIEVPFMFTDDKAEYAEREKAQREAMWAALEARRIKAL